MKPDLVWLVGPGSDYHPELRYSLRSAAANLPHHTAWIVGHQPSWVRNTRHIPTAQLSRNKYLNTAGNWRTALEHPDISDTFVLMNDDFYAMTPGLLPTPKHRGTITDMLDSVRFRTRSTSDYLHQIYRCGQYLEHEHGITNPLSYELHIPLPVNKPTALTILNTLPDEPDRYGYVKRSTYGNLAHIGGDQMPDVRPLRPGYWDWDWISSNDNSFKPGLKTRVYLEHRFPTPCHYEDRNTAPTTSTVAYVNTAGDGRLRVLQPGDPKAHELVGTGVWRAV